MGPDYSTHTLPNVGARWRVVVVMVAAVVGVALTARLGVWQLSRAQQKQALQQTLQARAGLPVLEGAQLAQDSTQAAAQHYRPVRLSGEWLPQTTVFLENRQMNGRPGFFVVTALRLPGGDAVLVQRGWAPRDIRDRTLVPQISLPRGTVAVTGLIAPPPARLYDFGGPQETGPLRQNIDLPAFALAHGLALRPLSVLQLDVGLVKTPLPSASPPDGLLRQWPAPAADVAKHHGYAFQWFALCALLTGLFVWFQLIRPWRQGRIAHIFHA